jgi:hypothetical protein
VKGKEMSRLTVTDSLGSVSAFVFFLKCLFSVFLLNACGEEQNLFRMRGILLLFLGMMSMGGREREKTGNDRVFGKRRE